MKALVYRGPGDIRCENVPDPSPPDATGAIVKIEAAAICGSDLHIYHGQMSPDGGYGVGHESIGEVVEVGSAVRRFRSGDRVLVSGVIGCGECDPCLHNRVSLCERGMPRVFGTNQGLAGGQAEALAVPRADLWLRSIPAGVSAEQALLLTDILPTGYAGAYNASIEPGQDVAVVGCGPVGLMAIMSAQLFGASRVFALDSVPERLAAAERLGAIPCDVTDGANETVFEATRGLGPHRLIEAVGSEASIHNAIGLVRSGGVVSVVGVNTSMEFPFPMGLALAKGLSFRIQICPVPQFWPALIPLIEQGRLRPEFVFTHRLGLSQGTAAYELFDSRRDGVLKVMLDPSC